MSGDHEKLLEKISMKMVGVWGIIFLAGFVAIEVSFFDVFGFVVIVVVLVECFEEADVCLSGFFLFFKW